MKLKRIRRLLSWCPAVVAPRIPRWKKFVKGERIRKLNRIVNWSCYPQKQLKNTCEQGTKQENAHGDGAFYKKHVDTWRKGCQNGHVGMAALLGPLLWIVAAVLT